MKIAWLINLYPPYVMGGNEMIARDIITELRNRGHQVYLLTGRGQHLPQDEYHLSTINIDLDRMDDRFAGTRIPSLRESWRWYFFDPDTYKATLQTLQRLQPDLVVIDCFSLVSFAPLLAAIRSKFRVLAQVNDKWLMYGLTVPGRGMWNCPLPHRFLIAAAQLSALPVLRYMTRNMSIVVNSNFMKQVYRRARFPTHRLHMIHLGIDVDHFSPHPPRAELTPPVRLMFAGHLWEGKGPQVAIRALLKLKAYTPAISFILDIYGKGKSEFVNYLKNLTVELGVEEQVHFRGFASQDELVEAFHEHDIFLFTSIWDEPFSITLLQAMSSGIPVVSSTAGGNPEAIEHKQTGLLIPPNDHTALAEGIWVLVNDSTLRCQISAQSSAVVRQKWSFRQYMDTLEALYQTVAA